MYSLVYRLKIMQALCKFKAVTVYLAQSNACELYGEIHDLSCAVI